MRPSELWARMERGAVPVMRAATRISDDATLLCLRGGDCGDGELALRLPLDTDVQRLLDPWDGLILTRGAGNAFPGQQMIRIAPADAGYRDLYTHLADDLHNHLQGASSAGDAVRVVLARLRLWSGFLKRSTALLDGRTVRGLFAELCVLERFLVPVLGWETSLGVWTGPAGTAQDVVTDHLALDVKATQVHDHVVTISSVEQLDPPGTRVVRLLQAQLSEGSGESLQALVSRLQTLAAASGADTMLAARLTQVGVTAQALDDLPEQPMQVQKWTLHRADDPGFPALRRAALPAGVVGASYRIDLSRSTAQPAELSELPDLLGRTPSGKNS